MQAGHVRASVRRLTSAEFGAMLESVRAATAALQRPIAAAYAEEEEELGLRKSIAAFGLIPEFAALSVTNQKLLLQVLPTEWPRVPICSVLYSTEYCILTAVGTTICTFCTSCLCSRLKLNY